MWSRVPKIGVHFNWLDTSVCENNISLTQRESTFDYHLHI